MKKMRFAGALLGTVVGIGAMAVGEQQARACGGCFHPPTESESLITDEKMILSVSMNQTTLYDQINYSGSPASFAWVLPIKGTVTVGLSADIMFQMLDQLTATEVQAPPTNCPPAPTCNYYGTSSAFASGAAEADAGTAEVTVTSQKQVGPYETVQLHSTDGNGNALTQWLTAHGYQVPDSTKPIINSYVSQGFDFLALKLVPGQGVQSMQPVRVTSQGASPTLPLHMVAVGTGPTTGITIWVVADGRWEPSNFPTFKISDSQIAWDWATSSSNYETLRLAEEAKYGGRGWQIESSLELSQYTIQQTLLQDAEYDPTGGYLINAAATPGDAGVGSDAATDASAGDAGTEDGGGDDTASEDAGFNPGAQENAATEDVGVLLSGVAQPNVRITRMRSDVAQAALSADMILQASADQSELTNLHVAQQEIGEPQCAIYNAATCEYTGTAPRSQAQAQAQSTAGGGCSTTPREGSETTLMLLLATAGVVTFRMRQRRRA